MNKKGFTLVEILVALAIFAMISGAIFSLLSLSWQLTRKDKERNGALAIATEKIEVIKNLPYDNVGTVGGVPSGDVEPIEEESLNSIAYTINTDIYYIDDDYDGTIDTGDTLNTDYKQVKIEVTWPTIGEGQPIELITNIAPQDLEEDSEEDTGTLYLEVYDSTPAPVSEAEVTIINDEVTPAISISAETNEQGIYILPGTPIATQSYQVSVTKAGYSTSQTYSLDLVNNPNPDPAHLSVGVDEVTNKYFTIDLLSDLTITAKTYDTEAAVAGFPFDLSGATTIGTDGTGGSIYKYDETLTTDGAGQVALSDLEPDDYNITFDGTTTGYDLAGYDQSLPLVLSPDTVGTLTIYLAPHTDQSLLVSVLNEFGTALEGATVRLYKTDLTYDQTLTSNVRGQSFFSGLEATSYNLDISKAGYQTNLLEVNINGQTNQTIPLLLSV